MTRAPTEASAVSQPWNPNVSPKGKVLGTYGAFTATAAFLVVIETPWPWKSLAAIPIAATALLAVSAWKAGRDVARSWTEDEAQ